MNKVRIHPSCALWLIGLFVVSKQNPVSYLLPIIFHELCHTGALFVLGRKIAYISFGASGLCINVKGALNYKEQQIVSVAGPLGSFLLYVVLRTAFPTAALISLALGIINLLPFSSFDGRGIIYPILVGALDITKCEKVCRVFDIAGTVFLLVIAVAALVLTRYNASVMFLAIYLFSITFLKNDGIF